MTKPKRQPQHNYTAEQFDWLRDNFPKMTIVPLTQCFNETFGANLDRKALHSTLNRHKIQSGRDGRFPKGNQPYNTDMKGNRYSLSTEFKKGNLPTNYKPVGTERITQDGKHWVKVADPRTWKEKHVLLWEQHHGPVPKGHVLLFKDQNSDNITLENLQLISRKLLLRLNRNKYRTALDDIKSSIYALSALEVGLHEKTRQQSA